MNEQTNANAATTALATSRDFIGQIMTPADFRALDGLIQQLGDRSANLTTDEKSAATAVVDSWNESVVQRIKNNAEQAAIVLNFLDSKPLHGSIVDETIEMFRSVLGNTPEYDAYADALRGCAEIRADMPISEPVEGTMTIAEAERIDMENRAARLAYDRKVQAADHKYARAVKAYIVALNKLPEIQDVRAKLGAYRRKATRMANECQDKAARAKLNIAISDPETRKLLHEMMDFTKNV